MNIPAGRYHAKKVRHSVYGLLVVVVGLSALLLIHIVTQHREERRLEALAYENHLRASEISLALISSLKKTKLRLAELELSAYSRAAGGEARRPAPAEVGLTPRDYVAALKYDISRFTGELNKIHQRYPDADYRMLSSVLKRITPAVEQDLDTLIAGGGYALPRFYATVENLFALSQQLNRMHQLSYMRVRDEFQSFEDRNRVQIIVLFLVALSLGIFTGAGLLRHLRRILQDMELVQSQLSESEENFSSLAKNMRGGVLVIQDDQLVFSNEGAAWLLSYADPAYLIGKALSEIVDPVELQDIQHLIDTCGESNSPRISHETSLVSENGVSVTVEVACATTTWQAAPACLLTLRNVSELKKANEALRETSNLLDSIVENVPNMIFLKRAADLSFAFLNRAGESLLGRRREELLGRTDFDLFPRDQAKFFTGRDRDVLYKYGALDIPEEPIETPQGTRVLHTQKIALYDAAGEAEYLLGISEDITEEIEAQRMLAEFKHTLDKALDSVFMFDPDSLLFTYANEGALHHIGYEIDELMQMHPYDIKPEFSEQAFREFIAPLLADHMLTRRFETVHRSKFGQDIEVAISLQCVEGADYSPRFVAIVQDIHERKQTERELSEYRSHLEDLVQARTRELVMARDEAERASAAKSEFLSHMSHELRTPMNAILGFGQILQLDADEFNEAQQKNIQEILDAGRHLLTLINEVLDLARIESGRHEIHIEDVDVAMLLLQCLSMVSPQAEARQIDIIDRLGDSGYVVSADPTGLKQVLLNLLSNAVKYNRQGGSITINGECVAGNRLRIAVTDSGPGMRTEQLERLFTPFERLDNTSFAEGTGIGLVISKHLLELMDGRIDVESSPGEGTTFYAEIPLVPMARVSQ